METRISLQINQFFLSLITRLASLLSQLNTHSPLHFTGYVADIAASVLAIECKCTVIFYSQHWAEFSSRSQMVSELSEILAGRRLRNATPHRQYSIDPLWSLPPSAPRLVTTPLAAGLDTLDAWQKRRGQTKAASPAAAVYVVAGSRKHNEVKNMIWGCIVGRGVRSVMALPERCCFLLVVFFFIIYCDLQLNAWFDFQVVPTPKTLDPRIPWLGFGFADKHALSSLRPAPFPLVAPPLLAQLISGHQSIGIVAFSLLFFLCLLFI